jgi:photosystem II stability/assembly factor-like uncharacterized protein
VPASALGEVLTDIAFVSPAMGYGYFVHQGLQHCQAKVAATADGGAVFAHLVEVTSWDCDDNPPVSHLTFVDQEDGFLYGPSLFVTHDGGRAWSPGHLPGRVLTVQAVGHSVWAASARCPSPAARYCRLLLFESSDGRRAWLRAAVPAVAANPYFDGAGGSWLVRSGPDLAYLLSSPSGPQGSNNYYVQLWVTNNGGTSWAARRAPCNIGATAAVLSAAPDGTLFLVCAGGASAGFEPKSVLRSVDGGLHWALGVHCALGPTRAPGCSSYINGGYLAGVVAVSASTVFVFGVRSSLLVSRDGGTSWAPVSPLIGDTGGFSGPLLLFSAKDAIVLGTNPRTNEDVSLWATSDGGSRWTAVVPHIAQEP